MKPFTRNSGLIAALLASSINTASAFEFGVFGDVLYYQNDAPGENGAFALGAVDFFASANISDDTRVFVEYVFENTEEGLITDLERLWITRTFSDEFSFGVGRFHSPLGTWNRTYHHGAIMQDTVSRPFFLEFEDGAAAVLPTHIVGALSSGNFILDSGEIGYEIYIANGPSLDTSQNKPEIDINVSSSPGNDKTFGFRLTYSIDAFPLQLGLMYMDNTIAESAKDGSGNQGIAYGETLIEQTISGFDINSNTEYFDLLIEYYLLSNDAKIGSAENHSGDAYFAQLGYKINPSNKLTYRYSHLHVEEDDDYFMILNVENAYRHVVAYRYDIDGSNALKFEYNQNNPDIGEQDTTLTVQWAFLVP